MKKKKNHELAQRLLLTILILVIYILGRSFLLYDIDPAAYQIEELSPQNIIVSMISGDRFQRTVFALGIMPYINSNLIIWIFTAIRGSEFKSRTSPQKMERITLILMLVIASVSAISRSDDLIFKETYFDAQVLKIIAVLEMVIGALVIYKMAGLNKIHGVGKQLPIILVNIVDNLVSTIQKFSWLQLQKPVFLCMLMAVTILTMENLIIHVPVQRVSIHNDYADKSFIAFKLDPIGTMPVMFAASFFMIPQAVVRSLLLIDESSQTLQHIYENLNLTSAVGAGVYLGIIFTLNLLFSFIMIGPGEMAKQLQKAGDSIVGIYAGKKTKRYLRRKLLILAFCSGCIFCLLMGISLWFALRGEISPELALFPATSMILTGIMCPLYREVKAYRKFDSYSFFV